MNHAYPKVSIIVPVLNRERSIGRCIQSLVELDYPAFEIIVVDNGSTDKTLSILSKYPVKLIHESIRGPYVARNTGFRAATGTLILFIDSDCIASKDLLKKLVSKIMENQAAGVGGQLQTHEPGNLVERFADLAGILQYNLPRGLLEWDKHQFLSGGIFTSNAMFKKEILDAFGPFDPDFKSGGDYDLCWRLQRAGHKIYFDPDAIVYHIHRSDLKGLIKQFFKYGSEQPHLLKKQPEGTSYVKIKTYLFPPLERCFKWPIRVLVNVDSLNLLPFFLIMALFSTPFLYLSILLLFGIISGTALETYKVAKKSGEKKWFLLYPFFHFIRNYSFTLGRMFGGAKHRILSI